MFILLTNGNTVMSSVMFASFIADAACNDLSPPDRSVCTFKFHGTVKVNDTTKVVYNPSWGWCVRR